MFYHHRASVWGVRIEGCFVVTASMDGTIALIDVETRQIVKHFMAHEEEWGGEFYTARVPLDLFRSHCITLVPEKSRNTSWRTSSGEVIDDKGE